MSLHKFLKIRANNFVFYLDGQGLLPALKFQKEMNTVYKRYTIKTTPPTVCSRSAKIEAVSDACRVEVYDQQNKQRYCGIISAPLVPKGVSPDEFLTKAAMTIIDSFQ